MFDPLFPLALFCGPLALAVLLRIEAKRTTTSIWPLFASVALALAAVVGLSCWGLLIGVGLFGEGMKADGLDLVTVLAVAASVAIVVGGYWFVSRPRTQEVP